jgi:hypothetical protein
MMNNALPGVLGLPAKTGWMNGELFVEVTKHYIWRSNISKDETVLLILDNHESHPSTEAVNVARGKEVYHVKCTPTHFKQTSASGCWDHSPNSKDFLIQH